VIAKIDLLEVGLDPVKVFQILQSVRKDHYAANEKIVIYHYDLDYYHDSPYGVVMYNFLQAVRSLDISPSVFVVLTSHYGLSKEIEHYWRKHCPWHNYDQDHMTVFESSYQQMQASQNPHNTNLDIDSISYSFMCLCGQRRAHRLLYLCQLLEQDIIQHGICSWHFTHRPRSSPQMYGVSLIKQFLNFVQGRSCPVSKPRYNFLQVYPNINVNEDWPVDPDLTHSYQHHHKFFDKDHKHALIVGSSNQHRFDLPTIKKALLYVSIESAYQHPYPFLTEKTFKAILMKRPFVILGSPGSLAKLRELGFQTFEKFWDESYDHEQDPNQRLRQIVAITRDISQLDVAELQKLCYNMSDILEHNAEHYRQSFAKTQLQARLHEL
jgi:hypothetical protein